MLLSPRKNGLTSLFKEVRVFKGHGCPRRKSRTSAPKSAFSCGPGGGEKLFDPWASGRKGQECLQEIRTKKFMFMLFFFPDLGDEILYFYPHPPA